MIQLKLKKQKKSLVLNLDAEIVQRLDVIKKKLKCSRTELINQIILHFLITDLEK